MPLDTVWVVANYKETQLTHVRIGQRASITVDTFPGVTVTGTLSLVVNTGTDAVSETITNTTGVAGVGGATAVSLGDVTGGGLPDLIVATSTGQVLLYVNQGGANPFSAPPITNLPGATARGVPSLIPAKASLALPAATTATPAPAAVEASPLALGGHRQLEMDH